MKLNDLKVKAILRCTSYASLGLVEPVKINGIIEEENKKGEAEFEPAAQDGVLDDSVEQAA